MQPTVHVKLAACRPHLPRTAAVALVVGTILGAINQLDALLAGRATGITWLKIALTYLVPFLVANYGTETASRSARPVGILSARPYRPGTGTVVWHALTRQNGRGTDRVTVHDPRKRAATEQPARRTGPRQRAR
jgi:hypothetical protein